jgi:hypothetical protein
MFGWFGRDREADPIRQRPPETTDGTSTFECSFIGELAAPPMLEQTGVFVRLAVLVRTRVFGFGPQHQHVFAYVVVNNEVAARRLAAELKRNDIVQVIGELAAIQIYEGEPALFVNAMGLTRK